MMKTALKVVKDAPRMPVSYTKAIKALVECQNLDEAKTFTDAAEALAVWARIYKQNEAGRQARQLRLKAHRRMGQLAREMAPLQGTKDGGREPGPVALLQKYGLTRHQADAAHHLAKIDSNEFNAFVDQDVPPAPTTVVRRYRRLNTLTPWVMLRERPRTPFACGGYIANNDPVGIAKQLSRDEVGAARTLATDLIQWLRAFESALPK